MVPPDSGSVPLVRLGGARGGAWPSARVRGSASAEPKWSDAFVELVAWFWTEGWAGSGGQVTITQSEKANPGHCARIRAALTAGFRAGRGHAGRLAARCQGLGGPRPHP
jgi:hypothetical protein